MAPIFPRERFQKLMDDNFFNFEFPLSLVLPISFFFRTANCKSEKSFVRYIEKNDMFFVLASPSVLHFRRERAPRELICLSSREACYVKRAPHLEASIALEEKV